MAFNNRIYGCVLILEVLILMGIFSCNSPDKHSNNPNLSNHPWTEREKAEMSKACIQNAKANYQMDSIKTQAICECATESFTSKYTFEQAEALIKKSRQEQMNVLMPFLKVCQVNLGAIKKKHYSDILWVDTLFDYLPDKVAYIKSYMNDSCGFQEYTYKKLKAEFAVARPVGYIRITRKKDSVYVLPPLNFCEFGDSYYFSDTSLPRLETDSYCCHPNNIFTTDDIDEDGIHEIVEFYSTCVSRFKALRVWSIKNGEWKEIATVIYDLDHNEIKMKDRIRKTGKGRFQLLELTDESIKAEGKNGAWIDHIL